MFFSANLNEGALYPVDPEICTSQNVTFKCILLSPPENKYKIGFAIQNESTDRKYVRAENDTVNVINETMSEFTLYNVTCRTYVRCIYGETSTDVDETKTLGYTSTILTYRKKIICT